MSKASRRSGTQIKKNEVFVTFHEVRKMNAFANAVHAQGYSYDYEGDGLVVYEPDDELFNLVNALGGEHDNDDWRR